MLNPVDKALGIARELPGAGRKERRRPGESSLGAFVKQPYHLQPPPPRPVDAGDPDSAEGAPDPMMVSAPRIVHFGGFRVGQAHEITVQVVNTAPTARRLTVLEPSTPAFQIRHVHKGILAPGMSESFEIIFTPDEYRSVGWRGRAGVVGPTVMRAQVLL
jgi:hypothetical protein